jgi:hypothetical protein
MEQGERSRARSAAVDGMRRVPSDFRLARLLIKLRPSPPDEASQQTTRQLKVAKSTACEHQRDRSGKYYCWVAEAWLAEEAERYDHAERAYQRIARQLGDARPVGQYYVRRRECLKMEEFQAELTEVSGDSTSKAARQLEDFGNRCALGADSDEGP